MHRQVGQIRLINCVGSASGVVDGLVGRNREEHQGRLEAQKDIAVS
jgi:hypothetical protein